MLLALYWRQVKLVELLEKYLIRQMRTGHTWSKIISLDKFSPTIWCSGTVNRLGLQSVSGKVLPSMLHTIACFQNYFCRSGASGIDKVSIDVFY